jgi:hypothetical protein
MDDLSIRITLSSISSSSPPPSLLLYCPSYYTGVLSERKGKVVSLPRRPGGLPTLDTTPQIIHRGSKGVFGACSFGHSPLFFFAGWGGRKDVYCVRAFLDVITVGDCVTALFSCMRNVTEYEQNRYLVTEYLSLCCSLWLSVACPVCVSGVCKSALLPLLDVLTLHSSISML